MDKELIAMCDTPEIQLAYCPPKPGEAHVWWDKRFNEIRRAIWNLECEADRYEFLNEFIFLPSVSWLLREIEVPSGQKLDLEKWDDGNFTAQLIRLGVEPDNCGLHSIFIDKLPRKPLVRVLMWRKGKVWKENQWRVK